MSFPKSAFEVWPEFPFNFGTLSDRKLFPAKLPKGDLHPSPVHSAMNVARRSPSVAVSHPREAASLDPRVRILPPQPGSAISRAHGSRIELPAVHRASRLHDKDAVVVHLVEVVSDHAIVSPGPWRSHTIPEDFGYLLTIETGLTDAVGVTDSGPVIGETRATTHPPALDCHGFRNLGAVWPHPYR